MLFPAAVPQCWVQVQVRTWAGEPVRQALPTLKNLLVPGLPTLARDEAGANPVAAWEVATSGIEVATLTEENEGGSHNGRVG